MDSLLETLKNLGPGRLIMMLVTFFGLIIFFVFIAVRSSAPALSLLYGDLSVADATEISATLDNAKIPYSLTDNGTKVSVPHKDISKARMLLAKEGLPHKGSMGYELFDQKQTFGRTSFEQNISALRALEGELSRTIGTIDQIRAARVHLVLPQRELFSRERQHPTASVFINLKGANTLGAEQVQSIQHLVAAAVPQLKPAHVAIVDQSGNLLAKGEDASANTGPQATARTSAGLRQSYETRLRSSVEDMVERIVGYGKVRATVAAEMNFDVLSRNTERFDPDGQVVRSVQSITEENTDNSSNGGSVTVENNLPGLPGGANAANTSNRTEETTNFDITKTVENLVRETGQVEKLSISVLVDGRYETDESVQKPKDADEKWVAPKKYVPRDDAELQKIEKLVKAAVGYDESRGDTVEVINMRFADTDFFEPAPFADDTIMGFPKSDILSAAETVALSIVAILVILLVLRPLVMHFSAAAKNARATTAPEEQALLPGQTAQAQLAGPGAAGMLTGGPSELETMIDMSSVEGKVKASSVQKISDLVTNHPNETVSVIRQWMSQEG